MDFFFRSLFQLGFGESSQTYERSHANSPLRQGLLPYWPPGSPAGFDLGMFRTSVEVCLSWAAIAAIKTAMLAEDSLLYTEPKTWMLPARQYLGSFYLTLKQYKKAEKVYFDDLVWNPGNGWSILGLYQSLLAQKKTRELGKLKMLYGNSFSHADDMPVGSVY